MENTTVLIAIQNDVNVKKIARSSARKRFILRAQKGSWPMYCFVLAGTLTVASFMLMMHYLPFTIQVKPVISVVLSPLAVVLLVLIFLKIAPHNGYFRKKNLPKK